MSYADKVIADASRGVVGALDISEEALSDLNKLIKYNTTAPLAKRATSAQAKELLRHHKCPYTGKDALQRIVSYYFGMKSWTDLAGYSGKVRVKSKRGSR